MTANSRCEHPRTPISSAWAFLFIYGMLWLIDRIIPVNVQESDEREGLDQSLHQETAYPRGA